MNDNEHWDLGIELEFNSYFLLFFSFVFVKRAYSIHIHICTHTHTHAPPHIAKHSVCVWSFAYRSRGLTIVPMVTRCDCESNWTAVLIARGQEIDRRCFYFCSFSIVQIDIVFKTLANELFLSFRQSIVIE